MKAMLEKIKKIVLASYSATEPRGVFFSLFDSSWKLIVSNGVIQSNKSLEETMETLFHGIVEQYVPQLESLVVDVVTSVKQETDTQTLLATSLQEYGLFVSTIDTTKSAVLLPNTSGIVDIKQWLTTLQNKFAMEGNVLVYIFSSERFVIPRH